jgi:CRISPR-associated protein Csc3
MQYHLLLREFVRDYAIPAMLRQGWAYKPAKSYASKQADRPEYHIDQPLRTHILNGLYAVTRVIEHLDQRGYAHVSERDFKRLLALYLFHDAYKDSALADARIGTSDFAVSLDALKALYDEMGLCAFMDIKAEDLRAASVSLLSPKVADFSAASAGLSQVLTWIHMADAFASQQTARDVATAERRLYEVSRHDAVFVRQDLRMSKRADISTPEAEVRPPLKFYYHELDDYRGLSTLLIHQATEEILGPYGLYPILYFANGTLYLGPEQIEADTETLRTAIAEKLFEKIKQETSNESLTVAKEACDARKGMKIEKYAYLFCRLDDLLSAVCEQTPLNKRTGFMRKVLTERVGKGKYREAGEFYQRYAIPADMDMSDVQAQRWFAASKLVMAAESIAGVLVQRDTLEWLLTTFHTPTHIADTIREQRKVLGSGGVSDYAYIIAYHWLTQSIFRADNRTWLEVELAHIQQAAINLILKAFAPYESTEHRLAVVEKELGFQEDVRNYLRSYLIFSFDLRRMLDESPLKEYEKERKLSHKRLCVVCNRLIPASIAKKSSEIKTQIAGQKALVFSNKLQPTGEVSSQMVWCPMCYLEFMLRKLSGQSYPAGSDYDASYRLHLYVLPDYSFTPQLWMDTGADLLRNFEPKETVVSRLALRSSKDTPSIPARWLQQGTLDEQWLEQVRDMFAYQAAHLKTPTKDGKPRRKRGDRITFSFKAPNYALITYDNVVGDKEKHLAPTHVEVWTKALYAAVLIHLLTGARVYITDKPYLSITRPEQMKTIIEMEGLHPLLYSLLPTYRSDIDAGRATSIIRASESSTRLPIAALPVMLDLLSAIWEINAALFQGRPGEPRNLDKQIATILEHIRSNYLAGAALYKMCEREKGAYATFTRACQILLPQRVGQADASRALLSADDYTLMMDKEGEVLMNLVQNITNTSLQLYLPIRKKEGRAHRYESLFRTGIEAIKSNATADEDELIATVAGNMLKRLDRMSGGKCLLYGEERIETVRHLAELLVRDLYRKRCGRSISKLTHLENVLANAIYFLTAQCIGSLWEEQKKRHPGETEEAFAEDSTLEDEI